MSISAVTDTQSNALMSKITSMYIPCRVFIALLIEYLKNPLCANCNYLCCKVVYLSILSSTWREGFPNLVNNKKERKPLLLSEEVSSGTRDTIKFWRSDRGVRCEVCGCPFTGMEQAWPIARIGNAHNQRGNSSGGRTPERV